MIKTLFIVAMMAVLTACSEGSSPTASPTSPVGRTPVIVSTAISTIPVQPELISPTPTIVPPTPTIVPPTPTTVRRMNTPTAQAYLETADLTSFVDTWNSADVSAIRSMYTTDARYYSQAEMQNLAQQQPVDVLVKDPTFAEQVAAHPGMTLRILGEPLMIYDKLVAFLYRWENETEGFDGAALLRYEGDDIFLHSFIESDQLTPNPGDDSSYVQDINLDELMNAWDEGDPLAAQEVYAENAVIFSDEDLAQAAWRDFSKPPSMGQLLSQFSGWNPAILGTPKRIGDMAVFAWHWERFSYPMGYGVRLVDFADGKVDTDIRYAIRPWEANGAPFMQP